MFRATFFGRLSSGWVRSWASGAPRVLAGCGRAMTATPLRSDEALRLQRSSPANARPVLAGRWRDWVEVTGSGTDPREFPARCVTGCGIVSVWAAFPPPFSAALMGLSPAPAGLFLRGLPCGVQPTVIWCLWFAIFRIPGNPMERLAPLPGGAFSCGSSARCAAENCSS